MDFELLHLLTLFDKRDPPPGLRELVEAIRLVAVNSDPEDKIRRAYLAAMSALTCVKVVGRPATSALDGLQKAAKEAESNPHLKLLITYYRAVGRLAIDLPPDRIPRFKVDDGAMVRAIFDLQAFIDESGPIAEGTPRSLQLGLALSILAECQTMAKLPLSPEAVRRSNALLVTFYEFDDRAGDRITFNGLLLDGTMPAGLDNATNFGRLVYGRGELQALL